MLKLALQNYCSVIREDLPRVTGAGTAEDPMVVAQGGCGYTIVLNIIVFYARHAML